MEPQSPNTSNESLSPVFSSHLAESAKTGENVDSQPIESGPAPQETHAPNGEVANQNAGMSMSLPKVVAPIVDDQAPASTTSTPSSVGDDPANPSVADDVDVVEKEWVDRARQIVEQTKNDPYRQEEEVEKLQVDYMKKRYGRDIKAGSDI